MREKLIEINSKAMSLQKDDILNEFEKWKGNNEQIDDVCVIGVRI